MSSENDVEQDLSDGVNCVTPDKDKIKISSVESDSGLCQNLLGSDAGPNFDEKLPCGDKVSDGGLEDVLEIDSSSSKDTGICD